MNVIIVGCGRVGAELALLLGRRGHDVTVIDHVGSSFGHLDPAYRGRTIEAEPLAEGVLERAGIRETHALASVTNSDAVNAVVAHVARTVYGVPNVVARNYDPRWRVLQEAMGLTSVARPPGAPSASRSCWSARGCARCSRPATARWSSTRSRCRTRGAGARSGTCSFAFSSNRSNPDRLLHSHHPRVQESDGPRANAVAASSTEWAHGLSRIVAGSLNARLPDGRWPRRTGTRLVGISVDVVQQPTP